jgi:hypothetical protein
MKRGLVTPRKEATTTFHESFFTPESTITTHPLSISKNRRKKYVSQNDPKVYGGHPIERYAAFGLRSSSRPSNPGSGCTGNKRSGRTGYECSGCTGHQFTSPDCHNAPGESFRQAYGLVLEGCLDECHRGKRCPGCF